MDLQQEQLARSLRDGHRVIHGVAGSGKTLILAYRCQHLAQENTKPLLVLCFNVSLAARLRQMIQAKGLSDRVVAVTQANQAGYLRVTQYYYQPAEYCSQRQTCHLY